MKIAGIEFPESLLSALHEERLVVFAGAGVSIGDPANLPTFRKLALEIARGTGETLRNGEAEDQFLGRLQHRGQDVHARAVRELSRGDPRPTGLHTDLLRVFGKVSSVRLVTTNFDTLFEGASDGVFDVRPKVFEAPALPLGSDFHGIVHVHGSLCDPNRMVLTDADFGSAYLKEGWATRFLADLFDSFSVIFVGYSHDDVVMKYLARSLAPSGAVKRFALTEEGDPDKWRILGIEPIEFRNARGDNFRFLNEGICGLADFENLNVFDWQEKINTVAKNPPPSEKDLKVRDVVGDALSEPWRTRIFCNVASDPAWIQWLDNQKHLDGLFSDDQRPLSGQNLRLAWWLAEQFSFQHADNLFLLIAKHGMRIHPSFWMALGGTIAWEDGQDIEPETLARWTSLLLATVPILPNDRVLPQLGRRCAEVGLIDSLVDIFDAMTVPDFTLRPGIDTAYYKSSFLFSQEVKQKYSYRDLKKILDNGLSPHLSQVVESLLVNSVRNLEGHYRTYCIWHPDDAEIDHVRSDRWSIGPQEGNWHPEPIDALIDAARECLVFLADERPESAAAWCSRLVGSKAPILRRLAIYALVKRDDLSEAEKIDWLLNTVGMYDLAADNEIREAMQTFYPEVTEAQRRVVIEAVMEYECDWPSQGQEYNERLTASAHFKWLKRLQDCDPSCRIIQEALDPIQAQYPEFRAPRQSIPDRILHSGPIVLDSPWTVGELLGRPGSSWAEKLLSHLETERSAIMREATIDVVEKAAVEDCAWGMDLAQALAESSEWDTCLWSSLLQLWSRELDETFHRDVLRLLAISEVGKAHSKPFADLLLDIVRRNAASYAPNLLTETNRAARALWNNATEFDVPDDDADEEHWLKRSLDHPGTALALYWLHSLSLWLGQQDPKPDAMSQDYSEVFSRIVEDGTLAGQLGKTVIASKVQFMMDVDEAWSLSNLFPLFWLDGGSDYRFVWHGISGSNFNFCVGDKLQDAYYHAISQMATLFPKKSDRRNQFIDSCIGMMIHIVEDPVKCWIPRLFENFTAKDRIRFASTVRFELGEMNDEEQRSWWDHWLKEYWQNRLDGIPRTLSACEVKAMLEWLPYFQGVFPEAVDYATRMPLYSIEEPDTIVYEVRATDLWSKYPDATVRLLVYLAGFESPVWTWQEARDLIENLLEQNASEASRSDLEELVVVLGLGSNDTGATPESE